MTDVTNQDWAALYDRAVIHIRDLEAEVAEWRARLQRYGYHHESCPRWNGEVEEPCSCGWEALRGEEEKA